MSGYNLLQKIRRLEVDLDNLGLMMASASHYYRDYGDVISVKPKDSNSLPIYSQDAELFIGRIEDLEFWLQGVEWARKYDSMIFGKTHDKNREKKEQIYRNEMLVSILKDQPSTELKQKV